MEKTDKKSVIIVAGGKGSRMGTEIPKQFLPLKGKPVLMHTIQKFFACIPTIQIIVVLPFDQIERWNRSISTHRFIIPHQITAGGEERYYSVKNGLALVEHDGLVAIHDGVRPLVSDKVILEGFNLAASKGSAIPVVKPAESMREITDEGSTPVKRDQFRLIQTPQIFHVNSIKKAYKQAYEPGFTDDATVYEADENRVELFEGNRENIKITWKEDIRFAELVMKDTRD